YKMAQQKERIDGLTRIVEGMARTINELRENRSGGKGSRYSDEELIRRLGKMVDNINENYVSKAELKHALDNLKDEYNDGGSEYYDETPKHNRPPRETIESDLGSSDSNDDDTPRERIYTTRDEEVKSDDEKVVTPRVFDEERDTSKPIVINDDTPSSDEGVASGGSNATQYASAVRLYNKKLYSQAKAIFKKLDKEEFKSAPTNYYLGEIAYFTKRYEDAIYYFKKSASLYPKASYMHTLLLHTAISLEKSGQKSEAAKFYRKIVNEYSNSSSVSIAKIRLEKLQ
ncbi:MAG: tetratricopeptide repeat protein, partial [Campylobacterales bacterium]|nr:tetratricopeptide repeat protein [Campylobacterales bacterium]